jgi:hypothetical protein
MSGDGVVAVATPTPFSLGPLQHLAAPDPVLAVLLGIGKADVLNVTYAADCQSGTGVAPATRKEVDLRVFPARRVGHPRRARRNEPVQIDADHERLELRL